MMKRFLKKKSSSKADVRDTSEGITPSSVKPKKKKKSFLSIFSRKKKDKNSSKGFASEYHERSGTEIAVLDKNGSTCNSSTQTNLEVTRERSKIAYQEPSILPAGAKPEELASFEFSTTHSPDGSISSGFHEVQPSASRSESLSEPAHSVDVRHSQPVGSHSKKPCHEGAFQEDASDSSSTGHQCITASRSHNTGLQLDSDTLLLHPPLRAALAVQCRSSEAESGQAESVRMENSSVENNNNCEVDLGPATKLWIGQQHPVTFADGTTRLFSWNLVGDTIVGTTVGDGDGRMDEASTKHLSIEDQVDEGQLKSDEVEEEDSEDDLEIQHGEDHLSQPGKTPTCNLPQTRESHRLEDYSESVSREHSETTHIIDPNTSLLNTPKKSSENKTQQTSPELLAASACGCDHLGRVKPQEHMSCSEPNDAEEFDRETYSEVTNVSKDSASEEDITSRRRPAALSCNNPVQARRKHFDDSSIDGDTSSVFSSDAAGLPDRFSGRSKLALIKCNSDDTVLSPNSTINCAMWFDLGTGERSRGTAPEMDGIAGSVSSEFFRKSGVAKADKRSTLEPSKVDFVNAQKASSSSIRNLSSISKSSVSRTDSISSPVGVGSDPRWKSVTDLTRAGSRSTTSDAYNRPTPSVNDPRVAADLAKRFAAINTRFRTMAAEAISRRESGNFKEPDKAQSTGFQIGTRTQKTDLEDCHSTGTDSWKFDDSLKRSFNEPDRIGLENGRPLVTKDRTGSSKVDDSMKECEETPAVSGTLVVGHRKAAPGVRDRRAEERKYSSSGDLRFRFSEDGLSFPSSVSSFSNSSSSHVPSIAVNHNGKLTDATGRQVVQDADETPVANRPRKKTMHEQLEEVRSQVDHWHKDLTLNSRLRYANMFDVSE